MRKAAHTWTSKKQLATYLGVSDVKHMDSEILQQLEQIRVYVFIIMIAIVLWAFFKVLESVQKIFIGFKKTWDTAFDNRIQRYFDIGEYEKIIKECEEVLEKYPLHRDAIWYLARAYFGQNNYDQSIKYFKKATDLVPHWKDSAEEYIEILNQRLPIANNSFNPDGTNNAPPG